MNAYNQTGKLLISQLFRTATDEHGVVHVTLTDGFRDRLNETLAYRGYISKDENVHIANIREMLLAPLSGYPLELLSSLVNGQTGNGIVVFGNLPCEVVKWSPAPGAPAHSAKLTSLSEHLLLGLSGIFGEPYGVAKEGPRLVNELIPTKEAVHLYTGEGSRFSLGLHYENAALRFAKPGMNLSPKGLLLAGVSSQRVGGPKTMVAIARFACRRLPQEAYRTLRAHCAYIQLPVRQRAGAAEPTKVGPVPVILGAEGKEEVVAAFYGDMMEPVDAKAEWALKLLEAALNEVAFGLSIEPGTMAYLANGPVLHGRSDFEAIFDEEGRAQRWLQRVFVCDRLDAFNECRAISDRVFDIQL